MRRHKSGVSFHDPNNKENETSSSSADTLATVDVTDHDPKVRVIEDWVLLDSKSKRSEVLN